MLKLKQNQTMNDYAKKILPKVSEWKPLFKKELIKCINWAQPEERFELRNWCYDNFYAIYPDVLTEVYEEWRIPKTLVKLPENVKFRINTRVRKISV